MGSAQNPKQQRRCLPSVPSGQRENGKPARQRDGLGMDFPLARLIHEPHAKAPFSPEGKSEMAEVAQAAAMPADKHCPESSCLREIVMKTNFIQQIQPAKFQSGAISY